MPNSIGFDPNFYAFKCEINMRNNYIYRMDHDTGYAPNTSFRICSMTGCKNSKTGKKRNIEELAEQGSWVIGIGGKGNQSTRQANIRNGS